MIGQQENQSKPVIRVVGLDLSRTCTGVCLLTETTCNSFTIRPHDLQGMKKLGFLRNNLMSRIEDFQPTLAVVEGYSYGSQNKAFKIGEYGGIIKLALYDRNIRTIIIPPSRAKLFAAGKGDATKPEVREAIRARYGWAIKSLDAADATACALFGRTLLMQRSPYRSELEVIRKFEEPKKTCTRIQKPAINL
jgi:Holliday junction resolvasome RuvABC endonuclease subunit